MERIRTNVYEGFDRSVLFPVCESEQIVIRPVVPENFKGRVQAIVSKLFYEQYIERQVDWDGPFAPGKLGAFEGNPWRSEYVLQNRLNGESFGKVQLSSSLARDQASQVQIIVIYQTPERKEEQALYREVMKTVFAMMDFFAAQAIYNGTARVARYMITIIDPKREDDILPRVKKGLEMKELVLREFCGEPVIRPSSTDEDGSRRICQLIFGREAPLPIRRVQAVPDLAKEVSDFILPEEGGCYSDAEEME